MRIKRLLSLLPPETDIEYQGDPDAQFRGFEVRPRPGAVKGRFHLIVDRSWAKSTYEAYGQGGMSPSSRAAKAFSDGAVGVICSHELKGAPKLDGKNVIFTNNTQHLAYAIATVVRESLTTQQIVAITGSAGKSTTAAMVTHALRSMNIGRVLAPTGNQNIPSLVAGQVSKTDRNPFSVLEVAAGALRSFRSRNFSIGADVSVVTSISEAHLEYLKGLEDVAEIKSEVFTSPPERGVAVINLDTDHADLLVRKAVGEGRQLVTYGESEEATVRLASYDPTTHTVEAHIGREVLRYSLGPNGKHMAMNSLAVIATLRALGVKQWREGVYSLSDFEALAGRGQVKDIDLVGGQRVTLIDEAFNANPASIRASLDSLSTRDVPSGSRRVAILGDILELGDSSEEIHRGLSALIRDSRLDAVHLFGDEMKHLHRALEGSAVHVNHWRDLESMTKGALTTLQSGDVVLVKASGGMGLKKLVKEMTAQ